VEVDPAGDGRIKIDVVADPAKLRRLTVRV